MTQESRLDQCKREIADLEQRRFVILNSRKKLAVLNKRQSELKKALAAQEAVLEKMKVLT